MRLIAAITEVWEMPPDRFSRKGKDTPDHLAWVLGGQALSYEYQAALWVISLG